MPDYPQRGAFKCLGELRERFTGSLGEEAHKAACDGLSKQVPRLTPEAEPKHTAEPRSHHRSPSPSAPVCALTCRRIGAGTAAHGRRVRAL